MPAGNRHAEYDYRTMLDMAPRLFMLIGFEGEILFWSEGGRGLFGYGPEEMVGRKVWELYPDRTGEDFLGEAARIRDGEILSAIYRARHKEGSEFWVDVKRRLFPVEGGPDLILGSASDVSTLVRTEQELGRSEARMKAILDHAVEGIISIDPGGKILIFNKAAEGIFGYTEEEIRGENISVLMPQPYRREHDGYIEHYLETGEKRIIGIGREVRGRRKDGSVFPMELSVSELRFREERIFTGLIRDISERRVLENEILQVSERERQRIGRDLHDGLGQMLTGIKLISQNLARKLQANSLPGAEEVEEISKMIHEADEQAKALTHGLVATELGAEGFRESMHRMCERSRKVLDIECSYELDERVQVDNTVMVTHLYRIVQEAINNAVKHGKAERVHVRLFRAEEFICLEIEDNGIGFSETKNREKLKGIGMNTMKYRAHILGGHLEVRETGEGNTLVRCAIPLTEYRQMQRRGHNHE